MDCLKYRGKCLSDTGILFLNTTDDSLFHGGESFLISHGNFNRECINRDSDFWRFQNVSVEIHNISRHGRGNQSKNES